MELKIATWNINSVRLRANLVCTLLRQESPDVLCLQETKCPPGQFPISAFAELGYRHVAECGQSGYHGVAIVSKIPFAHLGSLQFCGKNDARHVAVRLNGKSDITIHSLYVPAGGDVPDPMENDKFAHKLAFLDELACRGQDPGSHMDGPAVLAGDLNVAPLDSDVWSHKALRKVVSHTPVEIEHLEAAQKAGRWIDVTRQHHSPENKLYTWWSYRARDWDAADKGRRLDHIWVSEDIAPTCSDINVLRHVRGWERPSDHVPVIATFEL